MQLLGMLDFMRYNLTPSESSVDFAKLIRLTSLVFPEFIFPDFIQNSFQVHRPRCIIFQQFWT